MYENLILHSILIFRNKKNPSEYTVIPSTLAGVDILERAKVGKEIYIRSWADKWEFVCVFEKAVFEKGWNINLNSRDFNFVIEDESIFNDQVEFKALAGLHPILNFFLN